MSEPHPPDASPADADADSVDRLASLDDRLRGAPVVGETGPAGSDWAGLEECLRLLERAWPRSTGPEDGTDVPAAPEGRVEGARIGRFVVERVLGQGGFGIVYLARDPALGRLVAVKVPQQHLLARPDLHARFLREAQAAAGLDHPNIVPVHEVGEAGPLGYLVSAYCPGPTLADWLASRTEPVPFATAAAVVAILADAVQYSHGRGVLHRDLKPANVLLAPCDGSEDGGLPFVPRLTDFGLAKVVEASLAATRSSVVLGTPLYMAPEQAEGRPEVGPAADVYSLGVILYELLAGRPPFEGSPLSVLDRLRNDDPAPPRRTRPGLPRDLETVCLKCLRKRPGDRYTTAGDLAADLRRFLRGEPVAAAPPSARERFSAWAARPERTRDAGLFAVLLNGVIAAWVFGDAALYGAGVLRLPPRVDLSSMLAQSVVIGLSHLPLVWLGLMTLRRRPWAVFAGTAASAALLLVAAAGLFGQSGPSFGGAYNDAALRIGVFYLLTLLFATQFALFVAPTTALLAKRKRPPA